MSVGDAFVGRSHELATMAGELDGARAGRPRVLTVDGPAGIGKTSLIHCFLAGRPDLRVLWAGGDEIEAALPFGVVGQLVTGVPQRLLGPLLRAGPTADADPLGVGAELLTVVGGLQASGPVVVVVDDAQWVDDQSARALVFVVRRLRRDQVLVVLGARDEVPGESRWWDRGLAQRRLVLGGLDPGEIVQLSEAVGGPALTPEAGRRLQEHTGGHPLHTRALLAELPADALVDTARILPAPRSLASLVLVRVAKLSVSGQELVLAAAVLGPRCRLADAVALAAVPDPLAGLDEAVRAGLLAETLTGTGHDLAFSHQLVRAAVYADLPPAKRHALHLSAATLLGGAAATGHRVAAAVGPDPALAAELTRLAHDDLDARRWRQAADHLVAAAELSSTPDERAQRLVDAVGAMLAGGDLARALRLEPEMRAGPPGAVRSGVLGRLEALSGRFAAARATLTAAVRDADGDGGGRSVAAAHLALVSLVEGRSDAAAELAEQALDGRPAPEVATLARFVRVMGLAVQGRHGDAAAELAQRRDDGSDPTTVAEASAMGGVLALWADDAPGAAAALSAAVRDGAPLMSVQARVVALGHLAEAQYRVGDWDGAAVSGALAVSLARDAGVLLGAGITNGLASYVAAGRGEWDTARSRVAAAAGLLPWWGARAHAASAQAVLAQAHGDHAAMDEALQPYTDPAVLGPVERLGALPWRALRVEASLGLGRVDEADAALTDLEARVAGRAPGWSALEAARLRCEIAELRENPDEVRRAYDGALALAARVPAELSRARVETAYGRYLLAAGERRPAVDLLRSARERLERLGAAPFLTACDELLRAAGLHPPAAGGPLGLTAQELAVARLVAEGRTNQEAGAALYVTGRTVAFHLSNIYAKLGVSSRRELAAHLTRLVS
jgi:DNA-binding CsgD family transcriptional regulator